MSLSIGVMLSYLFFSRDIWYNFLWEIITENKDNKSLKLREWKGKSWLLIIAHLCIKPYWLAYKSGRLWLSVLEWIFLGGIYNRYQFFVSFPRYYSQKLIGKVVAKMVSFFKLCIWQNRKEESDRSSKRDYVVSEICRKYTFTVGHPNMAQFGALFANQNYLAIGYFILIFPTIERNNRKSQKSKFTDFNDFVLEYTYIFTFLKILKW